MLVDDLEDILDEFVVEGYENIDSLDRELVELEEDPSSRDLLASIFRSLHTLKGTAGFLALSNLEAVEEQAVTTNEIGRNVTEAARGSNEIAANITSVAEAADSTTAGAGQTSESAQQLEAMANELKTLVSSFRI